MISDDGMEKCKRALIAEVYAAFKGVTREGGVSWSQSMLHDHGVRPYTPREYWEAGERDRENKWEEIVDREKWKPQLDGVDSAFSMRLDFDTTSRRR